MSQRKEKFSAKLKDCIAYLTDKNQTQVIIACDVCGSTNIRIESDETTGHSSFAEYTCNNCGASCDATQEWCAYD